MDRLESGLPALPDIEPAIDAYASFYETLSPAGIDELDRLVRADMLFRDPFQEFRGRARFKDLFRDMYRTIDGPRFVILRRAHAGSCCFLKWSFAGALRGRSFDVVGVSEIEFDGIGLVASHVDHWDAASQFYERVPVLGGALRAIKRRFQH